MTHSTPSVPSLAPGTILEETCLWAPCISMLYAATSWSPQTPHLQFWKILGDWLVEVQNLSVGRNSKPKNTVLRTFRASCFGISPPMNKTFLIGAWPLKLTMTMVLNHWCNSHNPEPSASSVLCKWPVSITSRNSFNIHLSLLSELPVGEKNKQRGLGANDPYCVVCPLTGNNRITL